MYVDGGFRQANFTNDAHLVPSTPIFNRGLNASNAMEQLAAIQRGDFQGDVNKTMEVLAAEIQRTIASTDTGFPVREDLESYAKALVPTDTPVRNLIPRIMGMGTSHQWRQLTGFGGGWGSSYDQSGGGSAASVFYGEAGAPASVDSTYVAKSATYKALGCIGGISNFAMAAGANFQNQLAAEKMNKLKNLMLLEEFALINGDSTSTSAPWGNGGVAQAFDGLLNLVTTANGASTGQISTSVGQLTTAHLDTQLTKCWKAGGRDLYMVMNAQEAQSLATLAQASSSIRRVVTENAGDMTLGARVTKYFHPISGEPVQVLVSRFMPAGSIVYGSKYLADGTPALEVAVLPQVQTPIVPGENIQGYVAHDLAPVAATPDKYQFLVSVYEVLCMKAVNVFAKSTGVTAA